MKIITFNDKTMMKRIYLFLIAVVMSVTANAQLADSVSNYYSNSADNLLLQNNKLVIGGYGEVHYNQPMSKNVMNNGKLDVHRVIMLLGYNFNSKTQFISELEFEHVKEVYVEQAFLQYKLNGYISFRGGLMLVPMGIINEYHEPVTFNGVERPVIDSKVAPTTWREIGFGVTGNILPVSVKYQIYVMNGFNSYNNGVAKLNGSNGLRGGRQKGAESYISSPNYTGKVEYYGIRGLNIGLSGYFGKTQSTLYDGANKDDSEFLTFADSSTVGVAMIGLDFRYNIEGLHLRGQYYYSRLSNTSQYNKFTSEPDGTLNDLGSSMVGYYAEVGYNALRSLNTEKQLIPFIRYSFLNTHHDVDNSLSVNPLYEKRIITTGLTLSNTAPPIFYPTSLYQ